MWLTFADPAHRDTWIDWETRSRILLGEFRSAAGQRAGDPAFVELVEALGEESSEFRVLWDSYEVRQTITGPLAVRVDPVGAIRFDVVELRMCASPLFTLSVHVPGRPKEARHAPRRRPPESQPGNPPAAAQAASSVRDDPPGLAARA